MNWTQQLETIRWRSLEEAAAAADLVSTDIRNDATARARGELRAATADVIPPAEVDAFLDRRVAALTDLTDGRAAAAHEMKRNLTVPTWRGWWAWLGWSVAFLLGFMLTGLGSEREINLLSLPLVGLLLWNAVVMLGSLVMELMPQGKSKANAGWILSLLSGDFKKKPGMDGNPVVRQFHTLAMPLVMARAEGRGRGWLHLAAAVLAMGTGLGMYAKGWSREYRAVWESTLLDERQAGQFFGVLFGPAARCFGPEVPLEQIPEMQRGKDHETKGASALPWLHLYAGTLLLLIAVPRVVLAGITVFSAERRRTQIWQGLGWRDYVKKRLREIEGGTEVIEVLVHGLKGTDADQSRWRTALQSKLGGLSGVHFTAIESGEEDEFSKQWEPRSSRTALLFQLAATPEEEVQTRLATDVRGRLRERFADGCLMMLLDGWSVRERWAGDKIQSRVQLWTRMLGGAADEMEILGVDRNVNPLRVPLSEAR